MNDPAADTVNGWNESQMMIRFPPKLAARVREWATATRKEELDTQLEPRKDALFHIEWRTEREAQVTFMGRVYPAVVLDQPCVIEAWKKASASKYYKAGDVAQVLVVSDPDDAESVDWVQQNCRYDHKTFKLYSGITPPTRYVWPRVFRSQAKVPSKGFSKTEDDLDDLMQLGGKDDVEVDFLHPKKLASTYLKRGQVLKLNGEAIPTRPNLSIDQLIRERAAAVARANALAAAGGVTGDGEEAPPPLLSPAPMPLMKKPKTE